MDHCKTFINWLSSKLTKSSPGPKGSKFLTEVEYDQAKYSKILKSCSPFLYLSSSERNFLLKSSSFIQLSGPNHELISIGQENDYCAFLLLEGTLLIMGSKPSFYEQLHSGDSLGFDACIFKTSVYSVSTDSQSCTLMVIARETILQLISEEKQFGSIIGRDLIYKQNIFLPLQRFLNYVSGASVKGRLTMSKLVNIYKEIHPVLHPMMNSTDLDISAWSYAISRLPENITESFVYSISTTLSEMVQNDHSISRVTSQSRKRTMIKAFQGKSVILIRESETDLNDFLSNLCVHYLESAKLRRKLRAPETLHQLVTENSLNSLPLTPEEKIGLESLWGNKTVAAVHDIILHHEDFSIVINSTNVDLRTAATEKWTEKLWKGCQRALGTTESACESIQQGLIVDVIQGSTKTLLNLISPYYVQNKEKILSWLASSGIRLKTQEFFADYDKVFAAGFYYFQQFPEELTVKRQMEEEAGIVSLEKTEMTGVKVYVVNLSKLAKPELPAKGKKHLLINIGYPFGKQGYDIVKCFCMLFGPCIDSFAFIGKAGGLIGARKEILMATKFYDMVTKDIALSNPKGIQKKLFEKLGINVHKGPMLTVPGTILQNKRVLNYYKFIENCVGLEMEGYYYAQAIQEVMEMSLVKKDVPTRFLYYVSDLPLDPSSNLSQEGKNVSWDEGIPTMNALTAECLRLCGKNVNFTVKNRLIRFLTSCKSVAFVQKYWDVAQELICLGCPVVAFVNADDDLPNLAGKFITVDYSEDFEFLIQIESLVAADKPNEKKMFAMFEKPRNVKESYLRENSNINLAYKSNLYAPGLKYIVGIGENEDPSVEGAAMCIEYSNGEYFQRSSEGKIKRNAVDFAKILLG